MRRFIVHTVLLVLALGCKSKPSIAPPAMPQPAEVVSEKTETPQLLDEAGAIEIVKRYFAEEIGEQPVAAEYKVSRK